MTRIIESAEAAKGDVRRAIVDLLYRLGDDELIIGHRNSEWTGLGPILEADIAFSSMAQDEIGHAVAYYGLLHELGEPDPDSIAFKRGPGEYRCCNLVALDKGDWAFSILRQYFYDTAESIRLRRLCESSYRPLAVLARKLIGEEKYHLMHGQSWIERLGPATGESHGRMQEAVRTALPHALGIFEPTEWSDTLAREAVCPREDELRDEWLNDIRRELPAAGLNCEPIPAAVFGGRRGEHVPELAILLGEMTKVFRIDPAASW